MTWTLVREEAKIHDFAFSGDTILVKSLTGYWRSDDYGNTWQLLNSNDYGDRLFHSDDTWFALPTYGGDLHRSADGGSTWSQMLDTFPPISGFYFPLKKDDHILLTTAYGPLNSRDNGHSWAIESAGLPSSYVSPKISHIDNLLISNKYFSEDRGASWFLPIPNEAELPIFYQIIKFGGALYGLSTEFKLYRSDGSLTDWKLLPMQLPFSILTEFATTSAHLYLNIPSLGGIFESTDDGQTWVKTGTAPWNIAYGHKNALYSLGDKLSSGGFQHVYKSMDGGANWIQTAAVIDPRQIDDNAHFFSAGNTLYLYDGRVIMASADDGETFKLVNTNLFGIDMWHNGADGFTATDSTIAVTNYAGLFYSPNLSDQWISISSGLNLNEPFFDKVPHFWDDTLYLMGPNGERAFWKRAVNSIKIFSGTVYSDDNNNGQRDAGEPPFPRAQLKTGDNLFSVSGEDGRYAISVEPGNDTIRLIPPNKYALTNPPYYLVAGEANGTRYRALPSAGHNRCSRKSDQ